ncbi:MAG: nucleotidyltransferase domain-containing protein [Candidatus Zixiibacteriota bacterium]
MTDAPNIDISPPQWEIVRAILQRHIPDREVWAFGSRVTGTARQYSDLDLVIFGDEPVGLAVMSALREDFSESELPFKVDLVEWATTGAAFRKVIEKDKVVIKGQGNRLNRLDS